MSCVKCRLGILGRQLTKRCSTSKLGRSRLVRSTLKNSNGHPPPPLQHATTNTTPTPLPHQLHTNTTPTPRRANTLCTHLHLTTLRCATLTIFQVFDACGEEGDKGRQMLLFSATMPPWVDKVTKYKHATAAVRCFMFYVSPSVT